MAAGGLSAALGFRVFFRFFRVLGFRIYGSGLLGFRA